MYTGVTSDLVKRIYEHRHAVTKCFTSQYNCGKLAYYEMCGIMDAAIAREKQPKNLSRNKKMILIENMNPEWQDLYEEII